MGWLDTSWTFVRYLLETKCVLVGYFLDSLASFITQKVTQNINIYEQT